MALKLSAELERREHMQRKQDQARRQAARDAAEYNKRMVRQQARAFVN